MLQMPVNFDGDPLPEDPEYVTMSRVTSRRNIIESELFEKVLTMKSNAVFTHFANVAPYCLDMAKKLLKSTQDVPMLIYHLTNEIICRSSCISQSYLSSVVARASYFAANNRHRLAAGDLRFYDSLDHRPMSKEGDALAQIQYCISLHLSGDTPKAKEKLEVVDVIKNDPEVAMSLKVQMKLKVLELYRDDISTGKNPLKPVEVTKPKDIEPLKGYKLTRQIPFASNACEYVQGTGDKPSGVNAKSDIPKGEIVLLEDPVYFQFIAPFINCDMCGVRNVTYIPCRGCHYKAYCTFSCMLEDKEAHKLECPGFRNGLIPMLEASTLFRLFVQASVYISPAILDFTYDGGVLNNLKDAWNFIVEHSEEEEKDYNICGEFLAKRPDYEHLSEEKYCELIIVSFRLAVFIYNDTELIENFFHFLNLDKTSMISLVGAILLRLAAHILSKSHLEELHYDQPSDAAAEKELCLKAEDLQTRTERIGANAFSYYGIDAVTDFASCYYNVQHNMSTCKPKENPLRLYSHKMLTASLKNVTIADVEDAIDIRPLALRAIKERIERLSTSERCKMLETYAKNFHEYLLQYFSRQTPKSGCYQQKYILCSTIKSFRHNCVDENVKIICMSTGKLVGITTANVTAGTELVLCSDFLRQSEQSATQYVENCLGFDFPMYIDHEEKTFGVTCTIEEKCMKAISASEKILLQNSAFMVNIRRHIAAWKRVPQDDSSQRALTVLFGTYNSYLTLHFPEGHSMRLLGVIKFALFLASNGLFF
ncbi:hypothetical protein KR018_007821 [Drosophila ironensis]|nr:hypothetical protein KR018_007821 [Drosophila ironensis]